MTATKLLSAAVMGTALTVAGLLVVAQEPGTADDLGVMSIQLKEIVKPHVHVQAHTQAEARTIAEHQYTSYKAMSAQRA